MCGLIFKIQKRQSPHGRWASIQLNDLGGPQEINIYSDIALRRYAKFSRWAIEKFYLIPHMSNYVKDVVKGFKY